MEILQGNYDRNEFYGVKECAEVLGVSTKTIRNRIEKKTLPAVFNDLGKGVSHWLIPKKAVQEILESNEVSNVPSIPSIPLALTEELRGIIRAENEAMNIRLQAVEDTQHRIEKALIDRDALLLGAIRERQQEKRKTLWQRFSVWLNKK